MHACVIFAAGFILFTMSFCCHGEEAPKKNSCTNLAIGKPCAMTPAPNYKLCKHKADNRWLTDGKIYEGAGPFWIQKGSVGWQDLFFVKITVDLGETKPINGIGFHSAFDGPVNVKWPNSIAVFMSENDKDYAFVTDLIDPNWENDGLPPKFSPWNGQHKVIYWYRKGGLQTRGRFVTFLATMSSMYLFCDEVEVLRGEEKSIAPVTPRATIKVEDLTSYVSFRNYFFEDIKRIRHNAGSLGDKARKDVETKIARLESKSADADMTLLRSPGYRATVPLNDLHRELFRINAEALRLTGAPSLVVWHKHRWDPLEAAEIPESAIPKAGWERIFSSIGFFETMFGKLPELELELMNNEYRAEVLNLTNTRPEEQEIGIYFQNLPGGRMPSYIRVHQVEYAATSGGKSGTIIADALPEAEKDDNGYKIRIPSGMTRQVWFGVHPEGMKAGVYRGTVVVAPKGSLKQRKAAFNLTVAPFQFPDRPRLSLILPDYVDKPYGFKCMTDANVKIAIKDLKAHFMDTPYGHPWSACYPNKDAFDAEGKLVGPLQTKGFDEWVSLWKGARRYGLYLGYYNALPDFAAGEPIGSERFNRKIAQWSAAFAEHAEKKGIPPERIILHLLDEPSTAEQYRLNTSWAKAIKQGCPRFRLMVDPYRRGEPPPEEAAMLEEFNIICVIITLYDKTDIPDRMLNAGRSRGKELYLNNSPGGMDSTRLLDPYYYHLLLAWHCWKHGATMMSTWDYWNTRARSAWNEIGLEEPSYGLVYTTDNSITGGKHFEAIREGIEDYEYLAMLKDKTEEAKKTGKKPETVEKAETFLRNVPKQVADQYDRSKRLWNVEKDRAAADAARHRILELMKELAGVE